MQALGLIETRGLIAAIESADAMLKSAEVNLLEKSLVGGGLITIAVVGDVGAVKAAVESGEAAVRQMNGSLLISTHVIPRPHPNMEGVIIGRTNNNQSTQNDRIPRREFPDKSVEISDKESPKKSEELKDKDSLLDSNKVTTKEPEIETVELTDEIGTEDMKEITSKNTLTGTEDNTLNKDEDELHKEDIDKLIEDTTIDGVVDVLNKLTVVKLRKLAREYNTIGIAGREISKADKQMLIAKLREYYQ